MTNPSIRKPALRHSHENGNLERRVEETILFDKFLCGQAWIPACAGMTGFEITVLSGMMENGGKCIKNAV